jgi:hypothetical protein
MDQRVDERASVSERSFCAAAFAPGKLHRTDLNVSRKLARQAPIHGGAATSVWKAEKAQRVRGAAACLWTPRLD